MADNIGSLQIQISADAARAEKSIESLASSLLRLSTSLNKVTNGNFTSLASGIRQLSSSIEMFRNSAKTADFTRIATGLNKLAGVNVQGVSDASRAINLLVSNLNQLEMIHFDSQGIANIANAIASLGRKNVTQATANIPSLATALKQLVSGMNEIGAVTFDIKGLSELTASISKLGGKSASAAASGNISKLAVALKQMMVTLSSAPVVSSNLIQMTQSLAQLASAGSRAGTATNSLVASFNSLPSSTKKVRSSFSGLAGVIGKFYATYWLLIRGLGQFRKAIDISSDLTEVQNVVDVTFGDMSAKMDEFASSALDLYGMSELTAKQIGSRFQAMGVAMGFAQDDMADMSIRLTQLAGDLASFYNVSQDQIATSLQSIFTGETEPLRRYGLDLSFATVQAWALSRGIDADMQSMTQAEKTMLRYQYVLANTGAATGDFQRTLGTWANQIRLLTGNFEQLGSIVGGVLVNAFKPFIMALNQVMRAVINFAKVVSDALGAIFGWEYQTGGGVAQDLEAGASAAEGIEDATGGAADNAKKLNRYIAAWHEVNNMTSNEGSGGSGGGGGGGAGGATGEADGGQWVQSESLWEKYTSSIDTLYKLGDYIGSTLASAMNDIDWDSVYEGASNFGTGLASFLNGLISPELFGATGRTIAGALNTALHAVFSFGVTFDFYDLGVSIATAVNEFFRTFDFGLLAQALNVWVDGLEDAIAGALSTLSWKDITDGLGDFFSEIELDTLLVIIGGISIKKGFIGKFASAITKALSNGISLSSITLAIQNFSIASLPSLQVIGNYIIDKLDEFIAENFGQEVSDAMGEALFVVWSGAIGLYFGGPVGALVGGLIGLIVDAIAGGDWARDIISTFAETVFNFDMAKSLWETAKKAFDDAAFADNFAELGKNIVLGIISGIGAGLAFLTEPIIDLLNAISDAICDIFGIHSPAKEMNKYGEYILEGIIEGFKNSFGEWTSAAQEWFDEYVAPWFTLQKWVELATSIKDGIKENWDKMTSQWNTDISSWWNNNVAIWFTVEKWLEVGSGIKEGLSQAFNAAVEAVKGIWNSFARWLNDKLSFDIEPITIMGKQIFGGAHINLGKLPTFGKGGIVDKATLAIIGESGKEAVVPLEKNTKWINGVAKALSNELGGTPTLDLQVRRTNINPLTVGAGAYTYNGDLQTFSDLRSLIDYNRLGQAVYEAHSQALKENPVQIGDDDVYHAAQRAQRRDFKRTNRTGWAGIG